MSRPFVFRRFTVCQDKAAFKVGTDSVLLGAWISMPAAPAVLDIGTGTGLLALMLAQRGADRILGIEPDPLSFSQACENFARSPWKEKLHCRQLRLQELAEEESGRFQLIVANPPYFRNHLLSAERRSQLARHDAQLPLEELSVAVARLLDTPGRFCVILPVNEFDLLESLLASGNIFLNRICTVSSFDGSSIIRKMGEFSRNPSPVRQEHICLYAAENQRSAAYRDLTANFYLT